MPYGLVLSLIVHAILLGWALFLVEAKPLPPVDVPEAASISILADDGITRQKQGDVDAKNADAAGKEGQAKEPPKQEVKAPTPPPPPPPPAAAAPPPPPPPEPPTPPPPPPPEPPKAAAAEPSAEDQKLLDDKLQAEEAELAAQKKKTEAEAKAKAEAAAKAKAEAERKRKLAEERRKKLAEQKRLAELKKQQEPKKSFSDTMASALEKTPDASGPQKAMLNKAPPKPQNVAGAAVSAAASGPQAGTKNGTDTQLTASKLALLNSLMKSNVQRCWNINSGMEGAGKLVVTVEFKLGTDGRLVADPTVVNRGGGPQFDDAANSAKRALVDCQPYTNLPPELYAGGWDWMRLTFDPSKMF